jgi:hypothetical protein
MGGNQSSRELASRRNVLPTHELYELERSVPTRQAMALVRIESRRGLARPYCRRGGEGHHLAHLCHSFQCLGEAPSPIPQITSP